ncbi:MAG: glycosyltransferase family 4 protein [Planctomycetota bacterium]
MIRSILPRTPANEQPALHSSRGRIVFLNRSYWPDIEATGQLLTDLCEDLAGKFDIHVVCGQPNSPEKNASFLAEGIEQRNGVTIHRLQHRQLRKGSTFGRILNLVSFFRAARKYLRAADLPADIVVSETDPFLLPIAGAEFAKRVGAAHCVYLQDVYPDVAQAIGKVKVPFVASQLRRKLASVYRDASNVVVLGRCMRRRLVGKQWNLERDRIQIIPNWSDCSSIAPVAAELNSFRKRFELQDRFVVMHSGNMGLTQRLEVLISAAARPEWPRRAKLVLVGNGAARDQLLEHAAGLGLSKDRLEFIHYQPRHQLAESLSAADLHVVSMHEHITGCLCPSKLYGIMAAARPVLAVADAGTDLCQTIKEREIGWCVPPGAPMLIARAVANAERESREHPSEAIRRQNLARQAALERYDQPVIAKRFTELFSRLLPERIDSAESLSPFGSPDVIPAEIVSQDTSDSGIALLP